MSWQIAYTMKVGRVYGISTVLKPQHSVLKPQHSLFGNKCCGLGAPGGSCAHACVVMHTSHCAERFFGTRSESAQLRGGSTFRVCKILSELMDKVPTWHGDPADIPFWVHRKRPNNIYAQGIM